MLDIRQWDSYPTTQKRHNEDKIFKVLLSTDEVLNRLEVDKTFITFNLKGVLEYKYNTHKYSKLDIS